MDDDAKLVGEVLNGNIDSFNILINKYELIVLRFVYNMLKNKEAAEDITQETFITVYNKLHTYNDSYKFQNWLFQIAKNKSIDYMRKYKRIYEASMESEPDIASRDTSPEEAIEYMETKKFIESFIQKLERIDKCILAMKYTNDHMTFSDIAEVLNMSEANVKRRYYRSRDKFKSYIKQRTQICDLK